MRVYNLNKKDSYSEYSGITKREALVSEYMLNNNLASQLHNSKMRKELDSRIEICGENGRTMILGDFGITSLTKE